MHFSRNDVLQVRLKSARAANAHCHWQAGKTGASGWCRSATLMKSAAGSHGDRCTGTLSELESRHPSSSSEHTVTGCGTLFLGGTPEPP
eukprot:1909711-Rhodomonas_salina.2